jgi:ABC-type branched-subunit amino acid transport system substrate-binding protein
MFAGVKLAIGEINALGGVLGREVQYSDGDDGTDPKVATATVERLIAEGVQVIIGAGASGITNAVLPTTIAAGVVLFSPCNTAAALSNYDDKGLYFRTAPADDLQAAALTNIIMRDGVRKLVIVARDDAYGKGLMDSVKANLVRAGLADADVITMPYNGDTPDFTKLGDDVRAVGPDGVLIIGYDESATAYEALFKAGFSTRAA